MTDRRYPVQPLLDRLGCSLTALNNQVRMSGPAYRDVTVRGITELLADRWATRFGLHPAEVWNDWGLVPCAASGCSTLFAPKDRQSLYCTGRCRQREKMRRYRARPHGAANNRRYRQEYLAWERDRRVAA